MTNRHRILVIGSSCAGKSTFARALARASGLPWVELDQLFWGPNWTAKPLASFRALVGEVAAGERWVIDGNYSDVRDILWPRADLVVWLNYGFTLVLWRAVRRTVSRNITRGELWHGNRESFRRSFLSRESILVWVVKTFQKRRRQFAALRDGVSFPRLAWVEFQRPAQAREFLATFEARD
ncbi:MAG: toxin [Burkholderiaceae bacterium]